MRAEILYDGGLSASMTIDSIWADKEGSVIRIPGETGTLMLWMFDWEIDELIRQLQKIREAKP